ILGLLGPNGAGKSTLMKIITCYLPPTEGDVTVYGESIHENPLAIKKLIGYLPEHNPLYPEMYVREYLEFIAGIHHIPQKKRRIDEMINTIGLEREVHKKIGALSKGYRQRVGLGQALIHDPKVLILDEPTSGLDPNQLAEIRSLITNVGKEKTVILSTHIMQEVEAICNRVVIINKGKIVTDNPIDQLNTKGVSLSKIAVEFSQAIPKERLKSITGVVEIAQGETKNNYEISYTPHTDVRPKLFHLAVEEGVEVLSMEKREGKLEELFRSLTK
ncbi:MAG: gliding motility-associated ABC transporter ATP-binding subunit GldA, partial [Bacteroidetes bacterium]